MERRMRSTKVHLVKAMVFLFRKQKPSYYYLIINEGMSLCRLIRKKDLIKNTDLFKRNSFREI